MDNPIERRTGNKEIIDEIHNSLGQHVDQYHAFTAEELKVMVDEHRLMFDEDRPLLRDTNVKVSLLVDEIYGVPHPTAANPDERIGGMMEILKEMRDMALNGGFTTRREWTAGQWSFYGALATGWFLLVGTIIAAFTGLIG